MTQAYLNLNFQMHERFSVLLRVDDLEQLLVLSAYLLRTVNPEGLLMNKQIQLKKALVWECLPQPL